MTVKELKDYYFRVLKVNLKTKISIPDEYEVTEDDIIRGNIFQKYISGDTLTKIVNGFTVIDHKIYYVYANLHRIEILADDYFPPCGGESELMVNAVYSIRALSTLNADILLSGNNSLLCPINAIVSTDNPLFTYKKPFLINREYNNTDSIIEVNVYASYYFKGAKYEAYKRISQKPNTYSSWLVEEEPTQFISITLSEDEVSNKGGIVTAKVERCFTRIYYKKDSCGNKVGGKSEPGLIEDITNKCFITTSNKKAFSVNKNIIMVAQQPVGAEERECTVTARYLDESASVTLVQKEGGKITYAQELEFIDSTKTMFFDLETSIPTEKRVNIISKEYKYIDGEYDSVRNTTELGIQSDSDWVYGVAEEDENGVSIIVKVTNTNTDKFNDREATLKISSIKNPDVSIKLIVYQQALEVVKEEYHCVFVYSGEFTIEEIDNTDFYFHPYKLLIYENGDTEEEKIEDYITFRHSSKSTDKDRFDITSVIKKGEDYHVNFSNSASYSIKDINLTAKLIFYGKHNEKLFESDEANVTVKGNQIIDYNYELCFDEHNKFKELSWINSSEPKYIKVNSLRHKLVNGIYAGHEYIPFKIGIYDKDGKEYFDDSFSIKIVNDEILVFPLKFDNSIKNTYTITQKETGEKISFKLSYKTKESTFKIPFKVVVYSNKVGKDIWTGENGYLLIDNSKKIKLNPCWLSPNMKDGIDIAYNGIIELEEGIHTFETFNVVLLEFGEDRYKDCNVFKEITVDETTNSITLEIKV